MVVRRDGRFLRNDKADAPRYLESSQVRPAAGIEEEGSRSPGSSQNNGVAVMVGLAASVAIGS